jgi:hypothetical protein
MGKRPRVLLPAGVMQGHFYILTFYRRARLMMACLQSRTMLLDRVKQKLFASNVVF